MKIVINDETDFSDLNGLEAEEKVLIIKMHTLIETTKERLKRKGNEVSLPYKMQLKSDFGEAERLIKKFKPGKDNTKHRKKLEFLLIKLQTEVDNILGS